MSGCEGDFSVNEWILTKLWKTGIGNPWNRVTLGNNLYVGF